MSRKILEGQGGLLGGGNAPQVTPDNLFSEDLVEFTLGICEGPIGGLVYGPLSFYLDDTPLVSPGGGNNFTPFRLDVYHGDPDASIITNDLGGTTSSSNVNVPLAEAVAVTRTTPPALRGLIDVLEVRLVFNQLYQTNDAGDQLNETAKFKLQYRAAGALDWLNFFPDEIIELTGKTSGGYAKEFRKRVPRSANDWDIRLTKTSLDDDPNHVVTMTWESFQCVTAEPRAYDNLAVVKGLARASDQFTSIPEFSGIWAGKLIKIPNNYNPLTRHYVGTWDGTFVTAHTDNPAWVAYDVLMDPVYGLKKYVPGLLCDRFSFYDAARWCDQLVPRGDTGTFQPRFTYNDRIDTSRQGADLARYIVATFGGILTSNLNNTVRVRVDKPAPIEQVFAAESVTVAGFSYQYSDITTRVNDYTVAFVNPDLDWGPDVRQIKNETLIARNGRIPQDFIAVGCLDVYEAQRRAQNMLLKGNTEVVTVTFQTARQGLMLEPFSMIGVVDEDMNWGVSGRVKSVVGSTINLRDSLLLPVNTDLSFLVQTPSGVTTLTVRTAIATTKVLTIQGGAAYPTDAPARAQFAINSTTVGLVKPFRVLALAPDTENPDLFTVTALEYNVNRTSDADNMTYTPPQNYQGVINKTPTIPVITNVSSGTAHQLVNEDGTITSRMAVEISGSPGLMGYYEVFYRRSDETFQRVRTNTALAYIPGVKLLDTYEIYAVAVGAKGKRSKKSVSVFHTVAGRTKTFATPTGWTGVPDFGSITLKGDAHPSPDFDAFKIYGATAASTSLVLLARVSSTTFVRTVPVGDTLTRYKVSAVNRSGRESALTDFIGVVPRIPGLGDLSADLQADINAAVAAGEDHDRLVAGYTAVLADTFADVNDAIDGALIELQEAKNRSTVGWVKDPTFTDWVSGNLNIDNWASRAGTATYAVEGGGAYGGGLVASVPAGTADVRIIASTATNGGLVGADPTSDYVVTEIEVEYTSGNPAGPALRVEWSNDGITWVRGATGGVNTSFGTWENLGLLPKPGVRQIVQMLWKRPAASGHMRLVLVVKPSTSTDAQQMVLHRLIANAATQADIDNGKVYTMASAVAGATVTVAGIGNALALLSTNLAAQVGGINATLTTDYMTAVDTDGAIALASTNLSASIDLADEAAQEAYTLAGGKGKVMVQSTAPAVADRLAQNLWIDTTGGANTPKRWTGSAWVAVTDKVATDAATAAAAAQGTANTVSANLSNNYLTTVQTNAAISVAKQNVEAQVGVVEASVETVSLALVDTDLAVASVTQRVAVGTDGQIFRDVFTGNLDGWEVVSGTGEVNLINHINGVGGTILRLGNNAGDDHVRIAHKALIPFDPNKTYKTTVRLRRSFGEGQVFAGFLGVAGDGVTLVNTAGANSITSSYFHAVNNLAPTSSFADYSGYSKGRGATEGTTAVGTKAVPGAFHPDVRFLRPYLIANNPSPITGYTEFVSFTVSDAELADLPGEVVTQAAVIGGLTGAAMYSVRVNNTSGTAKMEFVSSGNPAGPAATVNLEAPNLFIRSDRVLIESVNRFPDYDMLIPEFYSTGTAADYSFISTVSATKVGRNSVSLAASAEQETVFTDWFSIDPSTEYRVEAAAWQAVAGVGGGTVAVALQTASVDVAGAHTVLTTSTVKTSTDAAYTAAGSHGAVTVVADATARRARFRVLRNAGGASAGRAGGFKCEKKTGADLLVDGAVKARHLTAEEAVITDTLQVGGLVIGTTNIMDLAVTNGVSANRAVVSGSGAMTFTRSFTITCQAGTNVVALVKSKITCSQDLSAPAIGTIQLSWNGTNITTPTDSLQWSQNVPGQGDNAFLSERELDHMVGLTAVAGTNTLSLTVTGASNWKRITGPCLLLELKK